MAGASRAADEPLKQKGTLFLCIKSALPCLSFLSKNNCRSARKIQ